MTTEEINDLHYWATKAFQEEPHWRLGQTYFNVLHQMYPAKANFIRATEFDPFHKEDNGLQIFFDKLKEL